MYTPTYSNHTHFYKSMSSTIGMTERTLWSAAYLSWLSTVHGVSVEPHTNQHNSAFKLMVV